MSKEITEKDICKSFAAILQSRDWHKLTQFEQMIVADLQSLGYLEKKKNPNGFVGRAL